MDFRFWKKKKPEQPKQSKPPERKRPTVPSTLKDNEFILHNFFVPAGRDPREYLDSCYPEHSVFVHLWIMDEVHITLYPKEEKT